MAPLPPVTKARFLIASSSKNVPNASVRTHPGRMGVSHPRVPPRLLCNRYPRHAIARAFPTSRRTLHAHW